MLIDRPQYWHHLEQWKDKSVIKVVIGVRRCGKSTLLELFARHLIDTGTPKDHIISINLESLGNESLLEYHKLYDTILSRCEDDGKGDSGGKYYVMLDEIQNVPEFQKVLDSLQTHHNIDLYVTGSNATMLSGTLATLISGRYVEISVTPLSFAEYRSAAPKDETVQRTWSRYLYEGSFPAIHELNGNNSLIDDYLEGILNTILVKDVVQRSGTSRTATLDALTRYMFDNIGNLTTPRSIANAMTSLNAKVSAPTVSSYLEALNSAFILYPVSRYDIKGKRIFRQERKYYGVDMGMRRILCSGRVRDTERILENIVFLELKRRNREVYIGQGSNGAIDFVTNGTNGPAYYQVCESVHNPETLERELSSFRGVDDNYPKSLITLDDELPTEHNGIRQVYALDWLLE
ncbi:ATP-binding protein [Bifidobacterium sp. ESL0745]|uniref:ATP-binding protein n=1 Tax=Bifidobacterium sp. ESL0745 TaxID=2983226 RepID=UPI0023F920E0|nr:ATP-binding protein [Bifidobacterium sp. ESL0745]MDF7665425.1 ATP-binding protein [Bifidobacterium sp. ESL0745]